MGAKRQEKSSTLTSQRSHQAFSREESPRPLSPEGAQEKSSSRGVKKGREREGRSFQKFSPPSEVASDNPLKKRKHKDSGKTQPDKDKQRPDGSDAGKGTGGLLPEVKGKVANNLKTPEGAAKTSRLGRKPAGSTPDAEEVEVEVEEEFQPPTQSFEAYLTYDQPPEKKRKCVKTPATVLEGKRLKKKDSKSASENLDLAQELPKMNAGKSGKPQPSGADGAKLTKVPPDVSPMFPGLPLFRVPPSYGPLPAFESMPSFQPKQRALSSPQEEEAAGFTGLRRNSKTPVYSGSKGAGLRKMMTLRQQCIRVLRNNISLLCRMGRVQYSVLEPILESCTPEQLHRLEKYNPALVGETDQLWKMHCQRKFKKERPEEHESWREMHMRLQEAQEQRLRALTLKIKSANKPKDRQAKMIFFDPSETVAAAAQGNVKIMPASYPTTRGHAPSHSASGHSFHPIPGKPAYDCTSTPREHLAQVASSSKKPGKQIAPMTVKDIKNRFSHR